MDTNSLLVKIFFTLMLLFGSVFLGISSQLKAQDPPGSIRVRLFGFDLVKANRSFEAGNDKYTWSLGYHDRDAVCIEIDGPTGSYAPVYHPTGRRPLIFVNNGNPQLVHNPTEEFTVQVRAWEDEGGSRCGYGSGDNGQKACNSHPDTDKFENNGLYYKYEGGYLYHFFRYADYLPGLDHLINFPFLDCSDFGARYFFKYDLPQPENLTLDESRVNICDNNFRILAHKPYINLAHMQQFGGPAKFEAVWEYQVGFDLSWQPLAVREIYYNYSLNVPYADYTLDLRSLPGMQDLIVKKDVRIRSRTKMTRVASGAIFYSEYATTSIDPSNAITTYHVSPLPPTIISAVSSPSCPGGNNTGTIAVNVTGLGEYIYALRSGENTTPCTPNPETGVDNCGSPSIRVFSNNFVISNVAKGRYTLMVTNKGGDTGVCPSFQIVDVGEIAVLTQTISTTAASCFGTTDGAVTLTASGGIADYEYTLAQGSTTLTNDNGLFTGLRAGTYTASVKDGCDQLVTESVTVSQPIETEASVTPVSPTCSDPSNGTLAVSVTQGSGHYTYRLLKGSDLITELVNTTNANWSVVDLTNGDYTLAIIDTDHASCDQFSQAFSLTTPADLALPAENVVVNPVTCYGLDNGSIELINGEGPGAFVYELTNVGTNAVVSPSAAYTFENLRPGNYQLTKKRNVAGCLDYVDYPTVIEITEPQQVSITLAKENIRCHGEDNGAITATVSGATPVDTYQWEVNLAGSWVTLPQTTSSLTNLPGGKYRLKLTSSGVCEMQSDEIEIIDPGVFSFSSVEVTDIKCLGDRGTVVTITAGGVVPYTYHYSSATSNMDATTESVELGAGSYTLKVSDAGGCEVTHPQIISISAPDEPLSLTYTLSDFSGFNVPCQGSNGGYIDIMASGGNGATDTGYQYSIDGFNYQSGARISNLKAGTYSFYVRDKRGCVSSDQAILTEPASQITVELLSKTDVKCYGDLSGSITVNPIGGTLPYTYLLNTTVSQTSNSFTGLPAGNYTITALDANGCAATYSDNIALLTTPMYLSIRKKDALCFDQASGTISVEVSGGDSPLRYEWTDKPEDVAVRNNLAVGDYTVRVVDAQGCTQTGSASIAQPDPLTISSTTIPVCVGQLTGEIRMQAGGGTSPFQYALADKSNYQSSGVFTNVASGTYTIYVKDFNNCEADYQTEVTVRNDRPEPDFIVASKENARDTLVVLEISVPKPDSVEWTFDPAIVVLKKDAQSHEIKIEEAGIYPVSMKGYFSGCEYSKTLNLTIGAYDPEKKPTVRADERAIKKVEISPNPSNGTFNMAVELNFKQRVFILVLDVLGTVRFKSDWEKTTSIAPEIVLPSNAPSGVYLVQVITDTELQQFRIIINR